GTVGFDEVAAPEIAEAVQDLAHQPGDGRLAGAGIAEEEAVQGRRLAFVAEAGALALGGQHIDQPSDLRLDRGEADHGVELRERLIERARPTDNGRGRGASITRLLVWRRTAIGARELVRGR